MIRYEQLTITIITILLIVLSAYFIVDFYMNENSSSMDFDSKLTPIHASLKEHNQNIDSESAAKMFSKIQNKE